MIKMEIRKSKILNGEQDGLFSTERFEIGSIIYTLSGKRLTYPTRESIHIGNNEHIVDPMGSYINHSFTPNTIIKGVNVIAIKLISPGDELTFNYNHSELVMACPFTVNGVSVHGSNP